MAILNTLIVGIAATVPLSALARSRVQVDGGWLNRPMHSYGSDAVGGRALKETVDFGASAGVSSGGDSIEASTGAVFPSFIAKHSSTAVDGMIVLA